MVISSGLLCSECRLKLTVWAVSILLCFWSIILNVFLYFWPFPSWEIPKINCFLVWMLEMQRCVEAQRETALFCPSIRALIMWDDGSFSKLPFGGFRNARGCWEAAVIFIMESTTWITNLFCSGQCEEAEAENVLESILTCSLLSPRS